MELEINEPKFKMPELKGIRNPLAHQGMRVLGIVLAVIVVISGIVYVAILEKGKSQLYFRQQAGKKLLLHHNQLFQEIPTITPLIEEAISSASPSPTREVRKPTGTLTPAVERVTVTPAPTI